ncbi:iron-containing redox enzyme family protein [Allokutzneria oryzae]|uniref:Iron-containing redox enzyme family protein n=1 Tax=Allokutzneria oryzae TaxID=1378989 RepID=A0ABV5ZTC0_9PSEU
MPAPAVAEAGTLPNPVGPLSETVLAALGTPPSGRSWPVFPQEAADPYGLDLHLALHVCYELHYRGFHGVNPEWEWNPELLRFRGALEYTFLTALRTDVPGGNDVSEAVGPLLVEPDDGDGLSRFLRDKGEWWQMREYFAHRSIYHLKEADPHAWVLPRLTGKAKAALVAVEFDEFGGGRADRMHSKLFADLLDGAGLDSSYLGYLDAVPAPALAVVNMMSMFGLHRALRGALVGHFAAAEITTAPAAKRMVAALRRLAADPACVRFYAEHVEADAVHEQVLRHDVLDDLLQREPHLAADVVFGVQATELVESRLAEHLMTNWAQARTSLLRPLP